MNAAVDQTGHKVKKIDGKTGHLVRKQSGKYTWLQRGLDKDNSKNLVEISELDYTKLIDWLGAFENDLKSMRFSISKFPLTNFESPLII